MTVVGAAEGASAGTDAIGGVTVSREATVSPACMAARTTVSGDAGLATDLVASLARSGEAPRARLSRVSHATTNKTISVATPAPFHRRGSLAATGSRCGCVPHHLHDPRCSG